MRARGIVAPIAVSLCAVLAPTAGAAVPSNLQNAFDKGAGNKDGNFTLSDCPVYQSEDADGQRICSGEVPSFDGTPLDVDLTLPDNATLNERRQSHPLMVMLHGFGNDKREWESKTNDGDGADKHHWNSHWFAEQHGYYVLTYTARGFHTDVGENSSPCEDYQPCTPGGTSASGLIRLKDRDFEIRDTQWLSSLAAASFGGINRGQVAVTGGSYGGGETWTQASQAQWTFPHSQNDKLPILQLQVAIPKYPWTDLAYSLGPNGHPGPVPPKSDGYCDVDPNLKDDACYGSSQGDPENDDGEGNPIGVLKQSYLTYFYARGSQRGAFFPAIHGWAARLDGQGEPYDVAGEEDPVIKDARKGLTERRSSYYQDEGWKAQQSSRKVAIFSIQGWTDDLFPAIESFRQYKYLKKLDPKWPVSVELADVGHPRAQNLPATWQRLNQQAWQFLQSNIGTSTKSQQTTISSHPTVCKNDTSSGSSNAGTEENDPTQRLTANTPEELSSGKLTVEYSPGDTLTTSYSGAADPNGPLSDPITTEVSGRIVPRPDTCRESSKSPALGGYTGYSDELTSSSSYIGLGSVLVDYELTGQSAQLDARLWDVTPGGQELLISRGTYRFSVPAYDSPAGQVRIPLFGNHYKLRPGHKLRLDLTQVDEPFLRPSTTPSTISFDPPTLNLPTRETGTQQLQGQKVNSGGGGDSGGAG